jgi:hypothetical protein
MVLREGTGQVIFSACRFLPSFEEAFGLEFWLCFEGLGLALQHSQLPIIIDSDCANLVLAIRVSRCLANCKRKEHNTLVTFGSGARCFSWSLNKDLILPTKHRVESTKTKNIGSAGISAALLNIRCAYLY